MLNESLGIMLPMRATDPREDAAGLLALGLNAALTHFHVRVIPKLPEPRWAPIINVYQAMCLQLANHIAENAVYLKCAAEDCDKLFVRTEGYSRYGFHRLSGHKYCSELCANRQAQREYRRRQRAKGAKP